ncbi:hypothetical protein E3P99_00052 [Wallemia hederae]|uniref:Zn(2)-C6 fungal-type domain-containing protein n=1 Tax=Wallemia hederae TaxID=1540922 RepID=A0A4T0FYY7_9BASI|nr:hypothetical protein E3P99_00052 [Wallemia hederae]
MTSKKKPKQDSGSETTQYQPTLKRGQACLSCRRLKLRCSADKPTCGHCARTGRECVYDSKEAREIISILKAQQESSSSARQTQPTIEPQRTNPQNITIPNQVYPPSFNAQPSSSSSYSEYGNPYSTQAAPFLPQMHEPYVVRREEATLYDTSLEYLHQPQDTTLSPSWLGHNPYEEYYKYLYSKSR